MKRARKLMVSALTALMLMSTVTPALANPNAAQPEVQAGKVTALFKDAASHWAASSIAKWSASGIISGYEDGNFRPDRSITRAEFVTVINRLFGLTVKADVNFNDVSASDWYSGQMAVAKYAGYYQGFNGNQALAETAISRQDAATLLARIFEMTGGEAQANAGDSFTDSDKISGYAKGSIEALSGIIKGYSNGMFNPAGSITRAETVTLIDRIVSAYYAEAGEQAGGTVEGNAIIPHTGTVLKKGSISGNLYLTAGIGDGEVRLEGVLVKGKTFVAGGGEHSVILNDSILNEIDVQRKDGRVRVLASGTTRISSVNISSSSKLELGSGAVVERASLNAPAEVIVPAGGNIGTLIINEAAAGTVITGRGNIGTLTVKATGVKVNGKAVVVGTGIVSSGEALPALPSASATTAPASGDSAPVVTPAASATPAATATPIPSPSPLPDNVVNLVDSEATTATRSLFAYLESIRGQEIIFGHQQATTEGLSITANDGTQSDVQNAVGDLPGMFGWDSLSLEGKEKPGVNGNDFEQNRDNLIAVMKRAHAQGGLLAFSAHMPNFVTGGDFNDTKGKVVPRILPGGDKHEAYNQFLDQIADFANHLKDDTGQPIPVIFRPFHEQNGAWFWWGAPYRTKEQYIELYRYTVEYLRDVKGVHNFLYAYSPNSSFNNSEAAYLETYPGDEFVDILGFDDYYDGNSEGWFSGAVQDAKLVSRLADAKGKPAAMTEFGYSNLRPSGTKDMEFYTKLLNALKSDPDSAKMAYMMTWTNFGTDNFFVPYKNGLNGLGDHPLLPDFVKYYEDPYSSFLNEIKDEDIYSQEIDAASNQPYLHIVTPTGNDTLLTDNAVTLRARVTSQQAEKVVYLVGNEPAEYPMTLDGAGFYYTAVWKPGEALSGSGTTLTVKSYARDGSVLSQTIPVYINDTLPNADPLIVDTFEDYQGNNELLDNAYSPGGDLSTISLDTEHKNRGQYGLKFNYNVSTQGYTGQSKNMDNADWAGTNQLKFWYLPDGSGQKLVIQIKMSGISFEAYPALTGTEAGEISIPFSAFKPAPWDTANTGRVVTKQLLKDVQTFSIYVNKNEGTAGSTGILYFDDIQAFNDGTGGVPDGGSGPDGNAAQPGLLHGFEQDNEGWTVEANHADASGTAVTADAAAEGEKALGTLFSLAGSDFELSKSVALDLSEVDTLTAKVKLSAGSAKARLYIKSGPGWTWTDSGLYEVDSTGFTVLTLPLEGIADLDKVRVLGVKFESFSGTGSATAYLDDVRIESAGVTPESPNTHIFEAETGILNGVSLAVEGSYSGTGYVTGFDAAGDSLQIPVLLEQDGTYMLKIHYRTIGGSKVNTVKLNGNEIANYTFAEAGTWKDAVLGQYDFKAGSNVVEIVSSWGWMDVDYIQLTGGGGAVTSVNLMTEKASGPVDVPLTLSGSANNSAEYRFAARKDGGDWAYLNEYSKAYAYTWKAPEAGQYELKVYARQIGADSEFDAESKAVIYNVLPAYSGKPLINPLFSSHMVLQREQDIELYGWDAPGSQVNVQLDDKTYRGTAGVDGEWRISIGSHPAGEPHTLTVNGSDETVTLEDILFGDVYLASGQSNMAFKVSEVMNASEEISRATNPDIRFFTVPQLTSRYPVSVIQSQKQWQVISPATAGELSAVGYFFARKLTEATGVPVGIIFSAVGGTKAENWTSYETLQSMPSLAQAAGDIRSGAANVDTATSPTALYNGMIAPLAAYKLKGVLWYQGESNWGEYRYYKALPALIQDWRQTFSNPQLPFAIIQISAFGTLQSPDNPAQDDSNPGLAVIRDAQLQTVLGDPLTTLVTTTDIGNPDDIHPTNKQDVGLRAAIGVLNKFYAKSGESAGPVFRSMQKSGSGLILSFDHADSGLMAGAKTGLDAVKEDSTGLRGFAVAGLDGKYYWADAQIAGNTVVVSSAQVSDPVSVKYNWNDSPVGNLYNKEGLPATPFRTDSLSYLAVQGGSGSGFHIPGEQVSIKAFSRPGQSFDHWYGDTAGLADSLSASTEIEMPSGYYTELAAAYKTEAGQPAAENQLEAEEGVLTGNAAVSTGIAGYSGSGYVSFQQDGAVSLTYNAHAAGAYELILGYSSLYGDKKTLISVNGGEGAELDLAASAVFTESRKLPLELAEGKNTIEIQSNWGYYNIDYVQLKPVKQELQSLLYGFEDGTAQGFAINMDGDGQYNTAQARPVTVTDQVYAEGQHALETEFSLSGVEGGGQFQLRRLGQSDWSGYSTVTAKVKIAGNEDIPLEGVLIYLFAQSGSGWETWSISDAGTLLSPADKNGFITVTLDISGIADRDSMQAFGFQIVTPASPAGQAKLYVDRITVK
ncbi:glycosyl hydrolase [Paenibacillus typhae]|uniref:glycosyl hydrolase n=1 Tax=Paenibacillus typhae TaxID=1174501 RepID=UPI001C8D3FDF|nr:glycosyl hydrolase [Paenibacillus typhae]MBY0013406.1 S-layer homology domain-containing protein [Paenibacillus typhae]